MTKNMINSIGVAKNHWYQKVGWKLPEITGNPLREITARLV